MLGSGRSRLRKEVEKAKRALSTGHQARVEVDAIHDGVDFSETITRAKSPLRRVAAFPLRSVAASLACHLRQDSLPLRHHILL